MSVGGMLNKLHGEYHQFNLMWEAEMLLGSYIVSQKGLKITY